MRVSEAASKELKELDLREWEPDVVDAATIPKKRDYAHGSAQLEIIEPISQTLCAVYGCTRQQSSSHCSPWQQTSFYKHTQHQLQWSGTGQLGGASTHHSTTASALRQLRRWFMSGQICLHLGTTRYLAGFLLAWNILHG